jgi:hypothetical protein
MPAVDDEAAAAVMRNDPLLRQAIGLSSVHLCPFWEAAQGMNNRFKAGAKTGYLDNETTDNAIEK